MTGYQTAFTTFYGTGIQGMWITWKNTAVDEAGTIDGATLLEVNFDLRMYAVGLDTGYDPVNNAIPADAAASDPWKFDYYL